MRRARIAALLCGWLFVAPSAWATTIDFETLTDLEDITTQFPGLTFSDAVALQSGVVFGSLNEFDVPPHSDFTVAASLTGLMEIVFDDLMESFSGFFTYFANLEIRAFMGAMQVASATSLFANGNNELGFNPGSSNEFLSVFFAGGFNRIELSGLDAFVADDISFELAQAQVPEPSLLALLAAGFAAIRVRRGMTARRAR